MNDHARTGLGVTILLLGSVGGAAWLMRAPAAQPKAAAPTPPASVVKPLKEELINTITLVPEAIDRLDLKTAKVEVRPLRRTRVYGGEITVPVGQAIQVSAPLSGSLRAADAATQPGRAVRKGQAMLQLLPLLTPEGRANIAGAKIEAEGQVHSAETQVDAARVALERAQRVFKSEAGSRRLVDKAQAQYDLARKALEAASARRELLSKVAGEVDKGTAEPLTIESPEDGILRTVSAMPGQTVPAGAPLFEVVDLRRLWVRVPVYVGDLAAIDDTAPAAVGPLTSRPGDATRPAKATPAPPTANATAGTVDRYYAIDNKDSRFSPGERVGVTVVLKSGAEGLTVPWSAVVHDIHGGSWVYEQTGDRTFVRRRVAVTQVVGDTALLEQGPAAGTSVVRAGAAELFGTETGFTK